MTRLLTAALLAAGLALAGCGESDDGDEAVDAVETTATTAPTTTETTAEAEGPDTSDPEVAAVVETWTTVFDSATPVEAKVALLADGETHRATLEAYAGAGQQVGGITLVPTDVAVDGDAATVTYDVEFAGNPAYEDQTGTAVRQGDAWVVATEQFCEFMASARTPCPG